jgi:hypothetical protein
LPNADTDGRIEPAFGAGLAQLRIGYDSFRFGKAYIERRRCIDNGWRGQHVASGELCGRNIDPKERSERSAGGRLVGFGGTQRCRCLCKCCLGTQAPQRRLLSCVNELARNARQLARPIFIFPRKNQTVTRGHAKREEIADLLAEISPSDREAIFLGGEFGFSKRHSCLAPTAEIESLVDRNGGLGAIEARIGSGAREILDFDVQDWIEAEACLAQETARGFDVGAGCDKGRRSCFGFLERAGKCQDCG